MVLEDPAFPGDSGHSSGDGSFFEAIHLDKDHSMRWGMGRGARERKRGPESRARRSLKAQHRRKYKKHGPGFKTFLARLDAKAAA
jgi:hypothetical protein